MVFSTSTSPAGDNNFDPPTCVTRVKQFLSSTLARGFDRCGNCRPAILTNLWCAARNLFLPSRKVNAFEEQPDGQQQQSRHHQREKPARLISRCKPRREIADDKRQA